MLQQTRVATAVPYYRRWMAAFPSVADLAAASPEAVREAWAGLGYYRRAAALHAAARAMVADATAATGDGNSSNEAAADLPRTIDGLRALPGVGAYTAGAVAAIAYGLPAVAVDGNVARVFARLRPPADVEDTASSAVPPVSAAAVATAAIRHATTHAAALVAGTGGGADEDDPGDLAQALMELGATVCTPVAPACGTCPVRAWCGGAAEAAAAGVSDVGSYVARWPRRGVKAAVRAERVGVVVVSRGGGMGGGAGRGEEYLLIQRPAGGLLGGLWEHPSVVLPPASRESGTGASAPSGGPRGRRRTSAAGVGGERVSVAERQALAAVVAAAGGGATTVEALGAPVAEVVHLFSHIRQTLLVHRLHVEGGTLPTAAAAAVAVTTAAAAKVPPREGRWVTRDGLAAAAVSTGMRKAFAAAVAAADGG